VLEKEAPEEKEGVALGLALGLMLPELLGVL
jgi:hypothetical protein